MAKPKMSHEQWRQTFIDATEHIGSDLSYERSAQLLRELVKSKLLKFEDMRDNPARFFEAHRLLLAPGSRGPGFGIRFTVQFNLFAGSILGLGSPEQVKLLEKFQSEGLLGCFCLTEVFAGVNSGLVVNTTCTWVPEKQSFLLNCPNTEAQKNWISQGLTASKAVVIADLVISNKHYGPHGFLIDLRESESGKPLNGIKMNDMGLKTTANDLDNARISFDNVVIPKSALLNRFADIVKNTYVQTTEEKMRLEIIGQRLLTGRLAIAQAGLIFAEKLFQQTKEFANNRQVWAPKGSPKLYLSSLPQLKSLFETADKEMSILAKYTKVVEAELSKVLSESSIPTPELVEKIACAKISCIETSIELCHKLKQEVGSYGLMAKTGFEHIDFLQCTKFAEGDSRILGQKIARDTMRKYAYRQVKDEEVLKVCEKLSKKVTGKTAAERLQTWNENWKTVYELSESVIQMHIRESLNQKAKL